MAQKPMLRAEVQALALRASQYVKRAEVWMGAPFAKLLEGAQRLWISPENPVFVGSRPFLVIK
jgi:hypothetical protein